MSNSLFNLSKSVQIPNNNNNEDERKPLYESSSTCPNPAF